MAAVPASRYWCFGILAGGGLAADLTSKSLVFSELGAPHRSSDWLFRCQFLWGRFDFRLTTLFNEGALLGIGQGFSWLFGLLSVAATAGVIYWLFVRANARSWWLTVTLGLIVAGALGNFYDRMHLHGWTRPDGQPQYGVRDFLDCTIPGIEWNGWFNPRLKSEYHWPVFNLADVFLVSGAIMLTLYSFVTPHRKTGAVTENPEASGTASPACDARTNSPGAAA